MATIPTFNSVALFTKAPQHRSSSPRPRIYFETMPGLDGEYAQTHGHAGRQHRLTGVLEGAAGNTRAKALENFHSALSICEALVDGDTVATFADLDGGETTNCIMLSYNHVGGIYTRTSGENYVCGGRCVCALRELAPQ